MTLVATVPEEVADGEADLVAAAQRGDAAAFDELVQLHQKALFAFAWQRVREVDEARELTQRTLVKAYESIGRFRGDSKLRTWLFSIAVRLCLDAQRKRPVAPPTPSDPPQPVALLETAQRAARLRACVAQLPEKQRLVVELRAFEELPFKEIGAVLDMSEDSAKANFHHALKKLREELEDAL